MHDRRYSFDEFENEDEWGDTVEKLGSRQRQRRRRFDDGAGLQEPEERDPKRHKPQRVLPPHKRQLDEE